MSLDDDFIVGRHSERVQNKHQCCVEEREHNMDTVSVYCLKFDQWLAMNYCGICSYFIKRGAKVPKGEVAEGIKHE